MLRYPQLISGALTQFPTQKRVTARTANVTSGAGRTWKLADAAAGTTEWRLVYTDLSDSEATALQDFFEAAEGTLQSFTLVDPLGNLLAWSADLRHDEWTKSPLLLLNSQIRDPEGREDAWQVTNTGAAPQILYQTLSAPPDYLYSFSAYVRSPVPAEFSMILGTQKQVRQSGPSWRRVWFSSTADNGALPVTVGLEIPADTTLELFGLQVEPQPAPSAYKPTTTGGIYEGARLGSDSLELTATGCNRNAATVTIIHVKHL